jgi:hypothetical protein
MDFTITFPQQILYAPPPSPIRATYSAHPILLALITRIIFGEEYKKTLPFYFFPLRPKLLSQHTILEHFQPIFLLQCERPTSHPYKTTGKIKVLHILIFIFLEGSQK